MPLTLDQLADPNRSRTLDELAGTGRDLTLEELIAPEDPEYPWGRRQIKPGPIARTFGRGTELTQKGLWAGLGAISWPFERMERAIATPLTGMAEARVRGMPPVEPGRKLSFGEKTKRLLAGQQRPEEWEESLPGILAGLKALVPWPGMAPPEETKTMRDLVGVLKEIESGREPSELYKTALGIPLDIAITPLALGKALKGVGKVAKLTGIPQKVSKARVPAWQLARMRARMKIGARTERATELGKTLGRKEATKIAKEISARTGKKIGYKAVQQRTGQIIKGGIVAEPGVTGLTPQQIQRISKARGISPELLRKLPAARPVSELAKVANPVIEEFERNSKTLRKLGILGEETYITKLPKKRITELLKEKAQLAGRIQKIKEPPYQKTLLKSVRNLTPNLNKQKRLADKFVDIAIKAEARGKKLSQMGDDFIDAAIDVTTGSPLAKKVATLMDFAPGDKRLTLLGKKILSLERMDRASRNRAATKILKLAARINPKVSKYTNQTVNDVLKIASQIEDSKIIGQATLLKKIASMKRRFPGQAKKVAQLQEKMGAITERIQTSYNLGGTKYMPRMYRSKEEEALVCKFWGWSKHRIRAHYAKQRKNIPEEVRRMMGEIKEPAYPVMKRLVQEAADVETAKLFNLAARNKNWASPVWKQGFAKKPLPDTKAFGALRGKYVLPRMHDDITEMTRIRNQVEQVYDTLIGSWKLGKVVLNPATHFRNKISNKILLDLSGMGYAEQTKYAIRALKEYRGNTKEYQIAKRYFARTTLIRGELLDDILRTGSQAKGTGVERVFNAVRGGVKRTMKKPAQLYQHEEFVNKFMKYLQQRDQGKSVIQAVQEANKWLFDYSALSAAEIKYARRIMPFYTFPRKAIPRVAEALVERPYTVAKYPLMAKAMTQYSLYKLDMTYDDYKQVQKVLPDYMKKGSYILMPYRDENNDLRFFDWTYIVPWGAIAEAQERGVLKSVVQNPLIQLVGDVMRNKSSWTEREIWKETDTPKEKTWKKTEYVWRNLTPALTPKGIYWDKLAEAATGKPSKIGKERLLPETIAHTIFGLRTQAIDVKEQKKWRLLDKQRQLKEFYGKMADITQRKRAGNITQKEYDTKRTQYMEQVRKLLAEGKDIAKVKLQ